MPEVKRFLREEKRYEDYKFLEMKWIDHHNPDLVILDDRGNEKERIDLTRFTYAGLEQLLDQKGFMKA